MAAIDTARRECAEHLGADLRRRTDALEVVRDDSLLYYRGLAPLGPSSNDAIASYRRL